MLVGGWQVGVDVKMVSTHDGDDLVRASGSRYAVQVLPALTIQDIIINSASNLLELRDIVLARAEEETCREIVHRIPVSQELKSRIERSALRWADETELSLGDTDASEHLPLLQRHVAKSPVSTSRLPNLTQTQSSL